METSLKIQSALLDAIYSAAIRPSDYLAFTRIWDATIAKIAEQDGEGSLSLHADALELRTHFNRAFEVFEKSRHGQRQDIKTFLGRQASASAVSLSDGTIIACNAHFTAQFAAAAGDNLAALTARLEPIGAGKRASGRVALTSIDQPAVYRVNEPDAPHSILVIERLNDTGFANANQQIMFLVRSNRVLWSEQVAEFLIANFGLTQAETDVSRLLFIGMRSEDIAKMRDRSKGTVRQQIKAIMEKTEASTQVALVTFLTGLHHLLSAKLPNDASERVHLSGSGRVHSTFISHSPLWGTIEFERYGAPDGRPVAFFHSEMSSAQPTPAMIDAMAKHGLLAFAPRKPGLGATSLERQSTDPAGFVSAFIQLLTDQGVSCSALIGQGMSGVAVVDYAAKNPDRTRAVVTINTGVPYTRREQFDHFPPVPKRIFWTIWECPDLFYAPFAFASEALFASNESERAFMLNQFSDIAHDLALISRPEFYRASVEAMKDFMSTPKRSADELVYWMHNWTDALRKVANQMPVLFLQSEHHHYLREDVTAEYLALLPQARLEILRDVALLCMIEKPETIAEKIASLIGH